MTRIGIVMINYNSAEETAACLKSLDEITISKGTVVNIYLVDNASSNDSAERAKAAAASTKNIVCKFIESPVNKGFSGGNNVGIRIALSEESTHVMLLNNDTLVKKDFLLNLLGGLAPKNVGVVCPKIYFAKGYEYHKEKYTPSELGHVFWYAGGAIDSKHVIGKHRGVDEVDTGQYDTVEQISFATGCCILVKRDVFERVGLLNEDYFLYFEDAEFSERVKKAGYKLAYIPDAVIWHKNAGSTGGSGSKIQDYFMTRNRLLFGMEYAPIRTRIALLRESLRLYRHGREWQKTGVRDYFQHKLGKGSYQ